MSEHEKQILLSGHQTGPNQRFYEYCDAPLRKMLSENLPENGAKVVFIPWALWAGQTPDDVYGYAQTHWKPYNIDLVPIHRENSKTSMKKTIENAHAIIVGGGSIHTLVRALHEQQLLAPVYRQIKDGGLYIGTSAGSIVACPTMFTASEPPPFEISSHETFGLIPFQIAAHYYEVQKGEFHHGPTPRQRLTNYLELNPESLPVLALPDGAYLVRKGEELTLRGSWSRLMTPAGEYINFDPGTDLSMLLDETNPYYDHPQKNSSFIR